MFKRIIIAVIAAQLTIVPAQAETQNKPQCTQGDLLSFGIGVIFAVSFILGIARVAVKKVEQSIEQEKKMEKQAPTCSL